MDGDDESGAVPGWAAQFDAEAFDRFLASVNEALRAFDGRATRDGYAEIDGSPSRYGLANLAQQWALCEPTERDDLVRDHFRRLLVALKQPPPVGPEILPLLRPRLWNTLDIAATGVPLLSRSPVEGLTAVVSVDLPDTVKGVNVESAAATGRTVDELWEIALSQIDDGQPVETFELIPGVHVSSGESLFVASRLLDLSRFTTETGVHGVVVAVPTRHVLLTHAINDESVIEAIKAMLTTVQGLYKDGPGSIAPDLYWWRADAPLTALRVTDDGHKIRFQPPPDFSSLLEQLTGARPFPASSRQTVATDTGRRLLGFGISANVPDDWQVTQTKNLIQIEPPGGDGCAHLTVLERVPAPRRPSDGEALQLFELFPIWKTSAAQQRSPERREQHELVTSGSCVDAERHHRWDLCVRVGPTHAAVFSYNAGVVKDAHRQAARSIFDSLRTPQGPEHLDSGPSGWSTPA